MRKWLLVALLVLTLAVPAFALWDDNSTDNSTNQDNNQELRNENRNEADADSRSSSDQRQGQLQGQAQGQLQGQKQEGNDVSVQGDEVEGSWAFAAPGMNAPAQSSPAQIYSIFGGISTQSTEEYVVCIEKLNAIQAMERAGYLSKEEAIAEARIAFQQMKDVSSNKRVLGIGCKTSGRDLGNGLGLLSWNEFPVNVDSIISWFTTPLKPRAKSADVMVNRVDNYTAKP